MLKRMGKRCVSLLLAVVMVVSLLPAAVLTAHAAAEFTIDGIEGSYSTKSGYSEISYENGNATLKASGRTLGLLSFDYSATLTLKNTSGKYGVLSFSLQSVNVPEGASLEIKKGNVVCDSCQIPLNSNESVTIKLTSPKGAGNSASVTVADISFNSDVAAVTFQPAENGSYTVNGETITEEQKYGPGVGVGYAVEAVPKNGMVFAGWMAGGQLFNASQSTTLYFNQNTEITAKFIPEAQANFMIGDAYFSDLNSAAAAAASGPDKLIVTVKDCTVAAGEYTIPAGVTLLIPYNDAHTVCTQEPVWHANDASASSSKAYRTLTMAEGASITIEDGGAISVASRAQNTGANAGVVLGPWGMIQMEGDSKITVESGANLYCYGFITGQGSVLVRSGANVYEDFQVTSFRGGSASLVMNNGGRNKVFPFTQYYIQNIEVPMTLEAGATETVSIGVVVNSMLQKGGGVLIGQNTGLFQLRSGTVTKRYDGTTDRLVIEVDGKVDISQMTVKIGGAVNIDSTKFVVPITNNMTVQVNTQSSLSIQYDMAMLPGSEILVDNNASLTLNSNLYVYDFDEWNGKKYAANNSANFVPLPNAPGKQHTRTDKDLADAKLDINGVMTVNGALYTTKSEENTTESGANITSSNGTGQLVQKAAPGTAKETYQVTQSNTTVTAMAIAITPARLKNADPKPEGAHFAYTETAGAAEGDIFVFNDQTWDNRTKSESVAGNEYAPHVPVALGEANDATCAEEGLSEGKRCTVCGKVLEEQMAIDKLAHTYDTVTWGKWVDSEGDGGAPSITATLICFACKEGTDGHTVVAEDIQITAETTDAACTKGGTITYTASIVIGDKTVTCETQKVVQIEAAGHQKITHVEAVEATCHTKGNIEHWVCGDCGMKFKDSDCTEEVNDVSTELDPDNHQGETEIRNAKSATCSQEGYTGDTYCVACDAKIESGHAIEKKPHTPGEAVRENVVGATCTTAGSYDEVVYCDVCHEEISRKNVTGQTLDHTWDEGEVTTAATCTQKGVKTFTCNGCGGTKTESIEKNPSNHVNEKEIPEVAPTCTKAGQTAGVKCADCGAVIVATTAISATGHSWNSGEVSKPATCTSEGVKTFTCTVCGKNKTEAIPATGHKLTVTAAKAPTCAEPGNPQYWTCDDCGKHFSDGKGENPLTNIVISATGKHTEVTKREDETAATCTAEGRYTEVVTCSVCQEEINRTEKTIPVAAHIEVIDKAAAPTCTDPGLTEGIHCSVCGAVLTVQETVPALGHSIVHNPGKEPTCTEAGWEAYETCSRCGYSTEKVELAATESHTYGAPVWNWTGDDETGYTVTATFTCGVCHQETEPIDAGVSTEYHAPTCTEDGQSTTYTATVNSPDGISYTDTRGGEKINANGHTYVVTWSWGSIEETEEGGYTATATATFVCSACQDKVIEETEAVVIRTKPTCTEKGSITYTAVVSGEDGLQAEGEKVEALAALGHEYKDIGSPATCTAPGYSKMQCSRCDDIKDNGEISATGHQWDSWTVTTAATCEAKGEKCRTCLVCGTAECETIEKLGHTEVTDAAKPATCTATGLTEGSHCSVCGTVIIRKEETPKAPHSYGQPEISWVQNDEGGWSARASFTCTDCGDTHTMEAPNKLTHKEELAATCTEAGTRVFTAEFHVNGETYTGTHSVKIAALGHELVQYEAQAPTCTGNGWEAYEACSRCDHSTKGAEFPATGHDYEVQWIWTGDGDSTGATLNLVCQNDQTHAGSVQAKVTSETTPATTQAAGKTVYTAAAVYEDIEYTATKEVEIAKLPTPSRPSGGGGGGGSYTPPSNPGSTYNPPSNPGSSYNPPSGSDEIEIDDPDIPMGGIPDLVTVVVTDAPNGSGDKIITVKQGSTVLDKVPGGVTASIPVGNATSGIIAVLIGADGAEEVIRKSVVNDSTLFVPVDGTANIAIRDNAKQFTDVAGTAWYAPAVAFVSSHELFNGVSATTFAPASTMSRAMLAQVLHNLENNPAALAEADFSDVASGAWYESAVAWASENQIVTGYTDGRFGSNDNISRQDMVVMLWRYAGKPMAKSTSLSFSDAGKVASYAREAMLWATENGIINGKGNDLLDPLGSATRAEVAKVIQNYLLYLVK